MLLEAILIRTYKLQYGELSNAT